MADLLAEHYSVISYDRRGFSRSPVQQPPVGWADTHTQDARHLLEAVGAGPAYVFGSSAGAVIGLDLISRYPRQVTKLIAHEPPLVELLPDAQLWRAFFEDVSTCYRTRGAGPAMRIFLTGIGLDTAERPPHVDPELIGRMSANIHTVLTQEVPNAPSYRPDFAALDAQQARITPAGGAGISGTLPLSPGRRAGGPLEPDDHRISRRPHRLLVPPGRVRQRAGRRPGPLTAHLAVCSCRRPRGTLGPRDRIRGTVVAE